MGLTINGENVCYESVLEQVEQTPLRGQPLKIYNGITCGVARQQI